MGKTSAGNPITRVVRPPKFSLISQNERKTGDWIFGRWEAGHFRYVMHNGGHGADSARKFYSSSRFRACSSRTRQSAHERSTGSSGSNSRHAIHFSSFFFIAPSMSRICKSSA